MAFPRAFDSGWTMIATFPSPRWSTWPRHCANNGVPFDQLVFPDEIHDFLLHRTWLAAYQAASDFFDRHFKTPGN